MGEKEFARNILQDLLAVIVSANGKNSSSELPGVYYTCNEVLEHMYMIDLENTHIISDSFKGRSYHLKVLIDMLVRRKEREFLETNWKQISYMQWNEFKPEKVWQNYLWRSEEGEEEHIFFEMPQSWKKLAEFAINKEIFLPNNLQNIIGFKYIFFLVFPHRLRSDSIKILEE
jgi:hypothetical protein